MIPIITIEGSGEFLQYPVVVFLLHTHQHQRHHQLWRLLFLLIVDRLMCALIHNVFPCFVFQKTQLISSCNITVDLSIHLWELNRPYIPYITFEGHTECITGKSFLNRSSPCLLLCHLLLAVSSSLFAPPLRPCFPAMPSFSLSSFVSSSTPSSPLSSAFLSHHHHLQPIAGLAWSHSPNAFYSVARDCHLRRHEISEGSQLVRLANPVALDLSCSGPVAFALGGEAMEAGMLRSGGVGGSGGGSSCGDAVGGGQRSPASQHLPGVPSGPDASAATARTPHQLLVKRRSSELLLLLPLSPPTPSQKPS